jgi:predicted PurR-regulated permease PerM
MTNSPARTPAAERRAERKAGDAGPPIVRTEPVLSSPLSSGVVVLAVLALIAALYVGKEVVLPIALAIVLKLLLQPVLNFLCTYLKLPTAVGALVLICGLFAAIGAVAFTVSGPASGWIEKAPKVLPTIKEKLVPLRQPIEYVQNAFKEIEDAAAPAAQGEKAPAVAVKDHSEMAGKLALGTLTMMGRLLATMVVLFFLLAAGDRLLRGFIEVLPTFSDKRQAAGIASEIQRQIGGYLITISLMNLAVGVVAGLAMWACGLGDPILWGSFAFLLNYVPIMGPLTGIGVLLLAGIVTLDWPWALLPAACYTMIHIAEGEVITPLLLAKRFTLNPVVVIVALFFWHALWGIPGALLAVPLLAMFKIICDRVEPLQPVGHIIGA